jgi:hypothetical protein
MEHKKQYNSFIRAFPTVRDSVLSRFRFTQVILYQKYNSRAFMALKLDTVLCSMLRQITSLLTLSMEAKCPPSTGCAVCLLIE